MFSFNTKFWHKNNSFVGSNSLSNCAIEAKKDRKVSHLKNCTVSPFPNTIERFSSLFTHNSRLFKSKAKSTGINMLCKASGLESSIQKKNSAYTNLFTGRCGSLCINQNIKPSQEASYWIGAGLYLPPEPLGHPANSSVARTCEQYRILKSIS